MPRIAFAGNRRLAVQVLLLLLDAGLKPVLLLVAEGPEAEGAEDLEGLLPGVPVLRGKALKTEKGVDALRSSKPDYLLSIHYPYIIPEAALAVPSVGTLNLHPALLPYTRGWHTPTWAIEEQTPYGATLHWVDGGVDTGDIALQKEIQIFPNDTAHTLYQRVLRVELDLFREALPLLTKNALPRTPQKGEGTAHAKKDIAALQKIDLDAPLHARDLLRRLRALTTNRLDEAAFFEEGGKKYQVRVEIAEMP